MTVDSLRTLYSSEEFFEGGADNLNYYSFLAGEEYLRKTARGRIDRFQRLAPGRRLLEVASAAGFFLVEAKAAGFDCEGIEFSGPMAATPRSVGTCPLPQVRSKRSNWRRRRTDAIASWGVMTIIRDPNAVIAKFHRALKPRGVWAFNTYDNATLWARMFGSKWSILVPNTSQLHNDRTLRRIIGEGGFDLVARRHDRPHASIERLLFVLATHSVICECPARPLNVCTRSIGSSSRQ